MSKMNNSSTNAMLSLRITVILLLLCVGQTFAQWEIRLDNRDNYAKAATEHFGNGEWEEGKAVVDKGLEKYPKDSDLRMLLGKYYFEKRNYDGARFELQKALEYNKHNVEAKQTLVNVETESGRYSSAICYINELLEVNPYWRGLWRKKIEVYRLQGNHVEANRLLKRISQIYPEDSQLKSDYIYHTEQEITVKKNEGKLGEAVKLAEILADENPQNEALYLDLVNTCIKAGDYEKALVYAEKGLYSLPNSINLIDKKADILGYLNRYDEALNFIQLKGKEPGVNRAHLDRRYSYFVEEAARSRRKSDPYVLYSMVYERNPRNEEALNYIVSTAISKGLYEDALEAIRKARRARGDVKELLVKEQMVYDRMGNQAKADQITVRLHELYPADTDIEYQYLLYRIKAARQSMTEERYDRAVEHWDYVATHSEDDEDMKKTALMSKLNCYFQLGKTELVVASIDQLIAEYPTEWEWKAKKAMALGQQGKYAEALATYESALSVVPPTEMERFFDGYDELATTYTKQLIEDYRYPEALQLAEHWLEVNPHSELGLLYATNLSSQMNDYNRIIKYANWDADIRPERTINSQIKLAQAHAIMSNYDLAYEVLTPVVRKNPYHKQVIGAFSQSCEDYGKNLMKGNELKRSVVVLDSGLIYDPDNRSLKYMKGLAYEKLHEYDSAHYYQSFYEPSPLELKEFEKQLNYLKVKSLKNDVGFYHLRSRYADDYKITTVSSVEYTRLERWNTYSGRLNYSGRSDGKGLQLELGWGHEWTHDWRTHFRAGVANKYFPYYTLGGSVFKSFKKDWEAELSLNYRRTYDHKNLLSGIVGVAKQIDPWWLNAKFNSLIMDGKWYYSLFGQARYYLYNPRSYLTAMGSFGSAPDIEIIENELYNSFAVTNSMVGLGWSHLINDKVTGGVFGTWHTYQGNQTDEYGNSIYSNLYNLYLQVNVGF